MSEYRWQNTYWLQLQKLLNIPVLVLLPQNFTNFEFKNINLEEQKRESEDFFLPEEHSK